MSTDKEQTIAMPCDEELYKAVELAAKANGRPMGREVAYRMQRQLKVGPFAKEAKNGCRA